MPKGLSRCISNDNQKCSDGLSDLVRDKGLQTLQTLSGCAADTYARKVRVIIEWLLFWLLGFFAVLLDALLREAKARFCGRNDWLLLPPAGIESRLLARNIFKDGASFGIGRGSFLLVLDASVSSIGTASRAWAVPLDAFTWRDCLLKRFPELDLQTL